MTPLTTRRLLALATVLWLANAVAAPPASRPDTWAKPVTLAGVPNLHQVSHTLYRSAQPTAAGMAAIEKLGFHPVWQNLPDWIKDLDADAIRKQLDLPASPASK
ncbi:MAG: hypothetical protein RLZZ522_68 [Verrucomicrobiota bacterium]|jgi:hypothetical protein